MCITLAYKEMCKVAYSHYFVILSSGESGSILLWERWGSGDPRPPEAQHFFPPNLG